jgi:hypothetical protein
VAILVLEAVAAPEGATTARTTEDTPETAAPGVELSDARSGTNRLFNRVLPTDLEKTVLMKNAKPSEAPSPVIAAPLPAAAPPERVAQ